MSAATQYLKLVELGHNIDRLVQERDLAAGGCKVLERILDVQAKDYENIAEENCNLRVALQFYAEPGNFPYPVTAVSEFYGHTARKALKGEDV